MTGLTLTGREALISEALAAELGAKAGDSITLRLAKPTDIPLSSLQGRRETTGERIRLTVARVLDRASLGEFSLAPSQGPVLAIYVPLDRLQRDLDLGDRVNTLIVKRAGDLFTGLSNQQLTASITLDDLGIRTRPASRRRDDRREPRGADHRCAGDADRRNCQPATGVRSRRYSLMSPMRSESAIVRFPTRPSPASISAPAGRRKRSPAPYLAERMGGGGPGGEGRRRGHARLLPLVGRGRARHQQRAVHARRRAADERPRRRSRR